MRVYFSVRTLFIWECTRTVATSGGGLEISVVELERKREVDSTNPFYMLPKCECEQELICPSKFLYTTGSVLTGLCCNFCGVASS